MPSAARELRLAIQSGYAGATPHLHGLRLLSLTAYGFHHAPHHSLTDMWTLCVNITPRSPRYIRSPHIPAF
jgi:hypothetical protein